LVKDGIRSSTSKFVAGLFLHNLVGRSESLIQYTQCIVSEARVPYHVIPDITVPAPSLIAALFLLAIGLVSKSDSVEHLLPEDVEPACNAALKLCGRFFDAAQTFERLEPENISANYS